MQTQEIAALVEQSLPGSQVQVGIDGNHVSLVVVSDAFNELSAVKRQQKVYAALARQIASGAIHAVHMKTLTPDEWQAQQ